MAERRTWGEYEGLVVERGDFRWGKTHCDRCGGRTNQRVDKKARHTSCNGGAKTKRPRPLAHA